MKWNDTRDGKREKLLKIGHTATGIRNLLLAGRMAGRGASGFVFMRGVEVKLLGPWRRLDGVLYSNLNRCCHRRL